MCGVEESFTARAHGNENTSLCQIPIIQSQPECSRTTQSQAFRSKMCVKDVLSLVVYHKGWQLTSLDVLTKSMLEFFLPSMRNSIPYTTVYTAKRRGMLLLVLRDGTGTQRKGHFIFSYKHKTASIIPHWMPLIVYIVVPLAEAPPYQ